MKKSRCKNGIYGGVWKNINIGMLFDGDIYLVIYFHEESINHH